MERVMTELNHEGFAVAINELRGFLRRMDATESVSEGDLRTVSHRIANLAPEVGEASRSATLNKFLQTEIAEYVRNFRALQAALDRLRFAMLARKVQIGCANQGS
jgi:hypothetical protein